MRVVLRRSGLAKKLELRKRESLPTYTDESDVSDKKNESQENNIIKNEGQQTMQISKQEFPSISRQITSTLPIYSTVNQKFPFLIFAVLYLKPFIYEISSDMD